jgi:cardiolipin synthase
LRLSIALPFVGLVIYYFFGLEHRKSTIVKRKNLLSYSCINDWGQRLLLLKANFEEQKSFLEYRLKLVKLFSHIQKPSPTLSHRVTLLYNSE